MTAGPTTKGLNGGSKTVCIVPIQSVCNNDTDIYMYMVHEKRDETKNTSLVDNETIAAPSPPPHHSPIHEKFGPLSITIAASWGQNQKDTELNFPRNLHVRVQEEGEF